MKAASKFDNQTRFNWGFWDGMSEGKTGREMQIASRAWNRHNILRNHHDLEYAHGWLRGWQAASDGDTDITSSEHYWNCAVRAGHVTPS